ARVAPRREATVVFPVVSADEGPGWFDDVRLNVPGTYRLQLLLLDSLSDQFVWSTPLVELASSPAVRYVSTEAVLTIEEPEGEDAAVWKLFLAVAREFHGRDRWTPLFGGVGAFIGHIVQPTIDQHP